MSILIFRRRFISRSYCSRLEWDFKRAKYLIKNYITIKMGSFIISKIIEIAAVFCKKIFAFISQTCIKAITAILIRF